MTKEERDEKKKERQAIREENRRLVRESELRFPGARVSGSGDDDHYIFGQIAIEAGTEWIGIELRKRGKWKQEPRIGEGGVVETTDVEFFYFRPPLPQVIELIRALTVRYNAIVEEMNRTAEGIVIPHVNPVRNGQ